MTSTTQNQISPCGMIPVDSDRDRVLLKLVAAEPTDWGDLLFCTGWPSQEINERVRRLLAAKRLAVLPYWGKNQRTAERGLLCLPEFARATANDHNAPTRAF